MSRRFLKGWAFFLFALVSACLPAQAADRQEIQEHYKRATVAMQARQNDVAAREFREIFRLDPHDAEAHANLGVIAYTEKMYVQPAEEFRAVLRLRPALWNTQGFREGG